MKSLLKKIELVEQKLNQTNNKIKPIQEMTKQEFTGLVNYYESLKETFDPNQINRKNKIFDSLLSSPDKIEKLKNMYGDRWLKVLEARAIQKTINEQNDVETARRAYQQSTDLAKSLKQQYNAALGTGDIKTASSLQSQLAQAQSTRDQSERNLLAKKYSSWEKEHPIAGGIVSTIVPSIGIAQGIEAGNLARKQGDNIGAAINYGTTALYALPLVKPAVQGVKKIFTPSKSPAPLKKEPTLEHKNNKVQKR